MADPVHLVAAVAGFAGFALIWLGLLAGICVRASWTWQWIRHQSLYAVHHTLITTGLTLSVVHGLAQLARPGGEVSLLNVIVPFTARGNPVGIGLGALALELMLCLAASILVLRRLGHRRWRALHVTAYVVFSATCWHVLLTGSDLGGLRRTAIVLCWLTTLGGLAWSTPQLRQAVGARLSGTRPGVLSVDVDTRRCLRLGFCVHEAPDLFRLESDGQLRYQAKASAAELEAAVRAAAACPARAILVSGEPTLVVLAARDGELDAIGPDAAGSIR